MWNGGEDPPTPRDMTPRAVEGVFGEKNAVWVHGKSRGPGSDLGPPGLAGPWAMHMTPLSAVPCVCGEQPSPQGGDRREKR